MNALDPAMFDGINEAIAQLKETKGLRAVVVSGEGRAFCAGLDLSSLGSDSGSDKSKSVTGSASTLGERTHGIANRAQHVAWGWREIPAPVKFGNNTRWKRSEIETHIRGLRAENR